MALLLSIEASAQTQKLPVKVELPHGHAFRAPMELYRLGFEVRDDTFVIFYEGDAEPSTLHTIPIRSDCIDLHREALALNPHVLLEALRTKDCQQTDLIIREDMLGAEIPGDWFKGPTLHKRSESLVISYEDKDRSFHVGKKTKHRSEDLMMLPLGLIMLFIVSLVQNMNLPRLLLRLGVQFIILTIVVAALLLLLLPIGVAPWASTIYAVSYALCWSGLLNIIRFTMTRNENKT